VFTPSLDITSDNFLQYFRPSKNGKKKDWKNGRELKWIYKARFAKGDLVYLTKTGKDRVQRDAGTYSGASELWGKIENLHKHALSLVENPTQTRVVGVVTAIEVDWIWVDLRETFADLEHQTEFAFRKSNGELQIVGAGRTPPLTPVSVQPGESAFGTPKDPPANESPLTLRNHGTYWL